MRSTLLDLTATRFESIRSFQLTILCIASSILATDIILLLSKELVQNSIKTITSRPFNISPFSSFNSTFVQLSHVFVSFALRTSLSTPDGQVPGLRSGPITNVCLEDLQLQTTTLDYNQDVQRTGLYGHGQ
ncbi:hypothetical protein BDN72DRAFT_93400 [Pluteus cervinus]|uniref:Uncharacterized protein n=1 Tax=Pluteus cervinus TaxID=181527 RepID=A0ACD3ANP6_9AGAR|nr:hypothetical protein BDN72DRAFT_93400 [Pluteus cervinus]